MNPQKTILNGQEYEFVAAEVVEVDYDGANKEKLYSIQCKILSSHGSQSPFDLVTARALDANIKNIPIAGEVVLLTKGPTAYNSMRLTGQEYYYTNPVSIQSSVHHNGIPGISEVLPINTPKNDRVRSTTSDGIPLKKIKDSSIKTTIHTTFPERLDVYPIQPYSGDIILEGRWGQSIRFGSTVDERIKYPIPPSWKKGLGETGNPILIISNGTNPEKKPINEFILENVDNDDSCIWLTSGQKVDFTPASSAKKSISARNVDLFKKNKGSGNQVIIASDRLIFNARKQEIIAFAKESIGLSSEKSISMDSNQLIEMESKRINLGLDAVSPVLLGDRTIEWLSQLVNSLMTLVDKITAIKVPTGVGPSGNPINTGSLIITKKELYKLRTALKELPSNLVFLNENSGGVSQRDKEAYSERKTSNDPSYIKPMNQYPTTQEQSHYPDAYNLTYKIEEPGQGGIAEELEELRKKTLETAVSIGDYEQRSIEAAQNGTSGTTGTGGTTGTTGTTGTSGTSGTTGTSGTPSTGPIDIYLDISSGTPNLPDLTQTIGNSDKYYTDVISDFLKNLPNNYLINFNSYLSNEKIIRYKVTLLGDKSASENNTTVNTFANSVVGELTSNGLSTNNVYPPNITVTSGTNNNGSYLWFSVRIVVL